LQNKNAITKRPKRFGIVRWNRWNTGLVVRKGKSELQRIQTGEIQTMVNCYEWKMTMVRTDKTEPLIMQKQ